MSDFARTSLTFTNKKKTRWLELRRTSISHILFETLLEFILSGSHFGFVWEFRRIECF